MSGQETGQDATEIAKRLSPYRDQQLGIAAAITAARAEGYAAGLKDAARHVRVNWRETMGPRQAKALASSIERMAEAQEGGE